MISFEIIIVLILVFTNILLGIFVFLKGTRDLSRLFFGLITSSFSLWAIITFLEEENLNRELVDLLVRLDFALAIVITYSFFQFCRYFQTHRRNFFHQGFELVIAGIAFVFIVFSLGGLIISNILFLPRGIDLQPTLLYYFYSILVLFFLGYGITAIFKKFKNAQGILKEQAKYVLLGLSLSSIIAFITNLVIPQITDSPTIISRAGIYGIIFFAGFSAYAITRYRLMDVRFVITRSILYFFLVLFVTGSFTSLIYFTGQLFGTVTGTNSLLVTILVSVFIVLLIDPLKKGIARMTEVIFFKSRIDYPKVLHGLTTIASVELNLQDLITKMTKTLTNEIKLHGATILLLTERKSFSPIHAPTINHITNTLMEKDPFLSYLRRANETIVLEELDRAVADAKTPQDRKKMEAVLATMELFKAEAAVPVISKNRLIAIIVLDRKLSGDVFNQDDINLLDVLAPQIASSIEKAQLYEKSLQFGERLKVEVKKATNDLRVANNKLKELDQSKSEFMSIASHQLRTPLTGLMGYLSMLSDGDYGNLSKKQIMIVHELLEAAQRLIRMVNLFLNVTRIEAGRFLLNFTPIDMGQLVGNAVQELRPTATKRKLTLIYNQPKTSLPVIQGDSDKIKDVALNLIDNAIKYTQQGSVTIDLGMDQKTNSIHVSVRDTGVGIEPHEAKKLFDKFVRGKHIARVSPDGSGLGLFIAKKIIDSHQGKIWVESEGEGKGSTFFFELPIKTKTPATM